MEYRFRVSIKITQTQFNRTLEDVKEIISMCDEGLNYFPDDPVLNFYWMRTQGDYYRGFQHIEGMKICIESWGEYIKRFPDFGKSPDHVHGLADVYVERGLLKKAVGDIAGMEEDYRKARDIEPNIALPK